tara:strand:+ start:619 stop:1038 length:420 start_codon:yes stop_codon:yes gene_type:complete
MSDIREQLIGRVMKNYISLDRHMAEMMPTGRIEAWAQEELTRGCEAEMHPSCAGCPYRSIRFEEEGNATFDRVFSMRNSCTRSPKQGCVYTAREIPSLLLPAERIPPRKINVPPERELTLDEELGVEAAPADDPLRGSW